MAKCKHPTAEEQMQTHLGRPNMITDALREELRLRLQPVGIMVPGCRTYYSCCEQYHGTVGYHHREYGPCPMCGRQVYHIKQCHIRKDERQEQFHFLYRRSIADANTILIMGVWVAQIWQDAKQSDPESVDLQVRHDSLIVIPYGGKPRRYVNEDGPWYKGGWQPRDTIVGGRYYCWRGDGIEKVNHTWEFDAATRGSKFEKMMTWATKQPSIYHTIDHANTLAEIAKYPQMEYMVARGLGGLVVDKINHATGTGLVNWRAKTIDKMLPLTRDELGRIKAKGYKLHTKHLLPIRYARKWGQTIKLEDAIDLMEKCGGAWNLEKAIQQWGQRYGVVKIMRYFGGRVRRYYDVGTWLDYMEELRQLGGLEDESIVFPRNLLEAHAETSARIKMRQSEADQKMLEEILPELKKRYNFQAGGVVLEPFATLAEVIKEGQLQSICIGSYAKRYASGGTVLCKMRRADAPDKPWHAVEFDKQGRMVQCRGYKNSTWVEDEKEVRAFWKAWDAAHKTHTRVNINTRRRETA